jgi:hypothetical protein
MGNLTTGAKDLREEEKIRIPYEKQIEQQKQVEKLFEQKNPLEKLREEMTEQILDRIGTMKKEQGLRYDAGKLRYDLIPAIVEKELAKVLTKGAEKYAPRNWEKGMPWSKVIASAERHFSEMKLGNDYDEETGLLHVSHLLCNIAFLVQYYHTYPQGDDRPHRYLSVPKIGLDIDEVLCDWVGAWCKKFGYCVPENWHFSYKNKDHFDSFSPDDLKEFYLNIPPKIKASEIPFEPHCYITSRSVPEEITKEWLVKHGFPSTEVYSVPFGASKVEVAKKSGIDIFVDDRYENFVELNNAGICTFLLDAPHNRRYNVGYKRIKSLKELIM